MLNRDGGPNQGKPNVLLVQPRLNFLLNPITQQFPTLLEMSSSPFIFGPGYTSRELLLKGPLNFLDSLPPIDIILVTDHMHRSFGSASRETDFYRRNYGRVPNVDVFIRDRRHWLSSLRRVGVPLISAMLEFDPYRVIPEQVSSVAETSDVVLGWGPEFLRPTGELPMLKHEPFAGIASDTWLDFLESCSNRVLSMPAFVEPKLDVSPLHTRTRTWSVVGTTYYQRREARTILGRSGETVAGARQSQVVAAVDRVSGGRIGLWPVRHLARRTYDSAIRSSRGSFACGSGLEYPLRKLLEIPAAGTVLFTPQTRTTDALGFVSGATCIYATPNDLPAWTSRLRGASDEEMQKVADAGRRMVLASHSLHARANQLREFFIRLQRADFHGAQWQNGRFHFLQAHKGQSSETQLIS